MITHKTEHGCTVISADQYVLARITMETPDEAVEKFIELCKDNHDELLVICQAYQIAVDWNFSNPGKGKSWPIFNRRERIINRLCREAGIVDS